MSEDDDFLNDMKGPSISFGRGDDEELEDEPLSFEDLAN